MPTLEPIATYLLEFRRQGRQAFLAEHRNAILLLRLAETEDESDEGWTGFNTNTFQFKSTPVGNLSDEELDATAKAEGISVLEIAKSPDNPWRGRISLGRARNNDLAVPSAGVSKLHAHFTLDDETAGVRVADAGSHNGTEVNGQRLLEGESRLLAPGDRLAFGGITAVFHTPASLCDYLDSLFA